MQNSDGISAWLRYHGDEFRSSTIADPCMCWMEKWLYFLDEATFCLLRSLCSVVFSFKGLLQPRTNKRRDPGSNTTRAVRSSYHVPLWASSHMLEAHVKEKRGHREREVVSCSTDSPACGRKGSRLGGEEDGQAVAWVQARGSQSKLGMVYAREHENVARSRELIPPQGLNLTAANGKHPGQIPRPSKFSFAALPLLLKHLPHVVYEESSVCTG